MIHNIETGDLVFEQGGSKGIRLYEACGNEYVHLSIQPGASIPAHALPVAVSFCVLKGSGTCAIAGSDFSVSEGEMLECPADALRGWKNVADKPLEILVIKRTAPLPG